LGQIRNQQQHTPPHPFFFCIHAALESRTTSFYFLLQSSPFSCLLHRPSRNANGLRDSFDGGSSASFSFVRSPLLNQCAPHHFLLFFSLSSSHARAFRLFWMLHRPALVRESVSFLAALVARLRGRGFLTDDLRDPILSGDRGHANTYFGVCRLPTERPPDDRFAAGAAATAATAATEATEATSVTVTTEAAAAMAAATTKTAAAAMEVAATEAAATAAAATTKTAAAAMEAAATEAAATAAAAAAATVATCGAALSVAVEASRTVASTRPRYRRLDIKTYPRRRLLPSSPLPFLPSARLYHNLW
jgi:hypothetical protein